MVTIVIGVGRRGRPRLRGRRDYRHTMGIYIVLSPLLLLLLLLLLLRLLLLLQWAKIMFTLDYKQQQQFSAETLQQT